MNLGKQRNMGNSRHLDPVLRFSIFLRISWILEELQLFSYRLHLVYVCFYSSAIWHWVFLHSELFLMLNFKLPLCFSLLDVNCGLGNKGQMKEPFHNFSLSINTFGFQGISREAFRWELSCLKLCRGGEGSRKLTLA